jgi:spoIIIJ-associated protein
MNERTTLEKIAPTVEEAVAEGLAELNLAAEDVAVEVLDNGSRGLFGVGGRQARIRLTLKGAEPAGAEAGAAVPEPASDAEAAFEADDLLALSEKTVSELLERMKIEAKLSVSYGETDEEGRRPVHVELHGEDLGVLVGRRAEILNALQYIVNLIVSKQLERWVQIIVDVEGYRGRHEMQLRKMARQMAAQAVQTGKRQVLEPMSPADRRIIHMELREHSDVLTQSIGEEPARKVTIVPKE